MSRKRGEGGQFVEKVSLNDVLAVLDERDDPVTGKEVGDTLDISNRSALDKLNELHARGGVERKKVGGGAVVWWLTDASADLDRERDYLKSFGKYAGTNIGETAENVSERFDRDLHKRRERRERRTDGDDDR